MDIKASLERGIIFLSSFIKDGSPLDFASAVSIKETVESSDSVMDDLEEEALQAFSTLLDFFAPDCSELFSSDR